MAGASAEMVQAAITARIDSAGPPSWVTPDRWKKAGALRALLERSALDPVGGQGTRDRAACRARLGLDARAQDRSLPDRLDPQSRRCAEDRQRRHGARPRQRRRPAHRGVRGIRVRHAGGSGRSAHGLAVVVHPCATRRSGLGARPHARGFVDEPGARADGAPGLEYAVLRRDYTRYRGLRGAGRLAADLHRRSMTEPQSRLEAEGYVVNGDSVVAAL